VCAPAVEKSIQNTITCIPSKYAANKLRLVLVASTNFVTRSTMRSKMCMRFIARADSLPRNAAKGERFDSYAERYRSVALSPIWTVEGFGFAP